jgi:hypothetical protein
MSPDFKSRSKMSSALICRLLKLATFKHLRYLLPDYKCRRYLPPDAKYRHYLVSWRHFFCGIMGTTTSCSVSEGFPPSLC